MSKEGQGHQTGKLDSNHVDFGFLPTHLGFQTKEWIVEPLIDYNDRSLWLKSQTAHDGFLYPPNSRRANSDGQPLDEPSIPSNLFKVPTSHRIKRADGSAFERSLDSESLFLTQCLGLIYDQRVTFEHWWLDKRVRYPSGTWGDVFYHVADDYLEILLKNWRSFDTADRSMITRLIMMHLRNDAYRWDFERFTFSFSIIDGLFRVARNLGLVSEEGTHGDRLKKLMTLTGVTYDEDKVRLIVEIRNNLIHEVKWDQGHPLSVTGNDGLQCSLWLPRLNQRLLIGLLGYRNKWVNSAWWCSGRFYFDRISDVED